MNLPDPSRVIADNQRAAVRMLSHFARGHGMAAELRAARQDAPAMRAAGAFAYQLFDWKAEHQAEAAATMRAICPALAAIVAAWSACFAESGAIKGSEVSESPAIPSLLNFSSLADAGAVWASGRVNPGALAFDQLDTLTPLQTRFGGWWEAMGGIEGFTPRALVSPRRARALALRTYAGNEAGTY